MRTISCYMITHNHVHSCKGMIIAIIIYYSENNIAILSKAFSLNAIRQGKITLSALSHTIPNNILAGVHYVAVSVDLSYKSIALRNWDFPNQIKKLRSRLYTLQEEAVCCRSLIECYFNGNHNTGSIKQKLIANPTVFVAWNPLKSTQWRLVTKSECLIVHTIGPGIAEL